MYLGFLVGALALAGFPLLSGFFSKDEIIFAAFASQRGSPVLGVMALAVVGLTGFYVFRAFFLCFHGTSRVDEQVAHHIHKPGLSMVAPVGVLAVLAALGGYINFVGGTGAIDRFLSPVFERYTDPVPLAVGAEAMQEPLMMVSVLVGLGGIFVAYLMYVRYPKAAARVGGWYPGLYRLFLNKWYVDELYGFLFLRPGRWLGELLAGPVDGAITDGIVRGAARSVEWFALGFKRVETGFVRDYALAILLGATVVLFYLMQIGGVR